MDAAAWFGLFGGSSLLVTVGIAIGISRARGKEIEAIDQRVHGLTNRINVYPKNPDDVYARKDVIAAQLGALQERVDHIAAQVDRLVGRP